MKRDTGESRDNGAVPEQKLSTPREAIESLVTTYAPSAEKALAIGFWSVTVTVPAPAVLPKRDTPEKVRMEMQTSLATGCVLHAFILFSFQRLVKEERIEHNVYKNIQLCIPISTKITRVNGPFGCSLMHWEAC